MRFISLFLSLFSLFQFNLSHAEPLSVVQGCDDLGSNVQIFSYDVALNGAGQTAYAWVDSAGILHSAVTLAGETICTELSNPNVQGVIAARSKTPQITIDNQGNIKLSFLTATSNDFNLPPAAPQTINGIKVSTININTLPLHWTDISTGLNFSQSSTSRGNASIEISLAGNGEGDAMLIWFEEIAQFNDSIKAAIFNTGITNLPEWITYTLDAGSNIDSNSINAGNSKPTASINSSGKGMFFWLGSMEGTPIQHRHLRAAAINAAKAQTIAPIAPTPQNVGHHIDLNLPSDGIIAYAGAIDNAGDALAIWPDANPDFAMMQYNTFSATSGLWSNQDPDRTIPGSTVTAQTNTILTQVATDPNVSHLNSFAVWNQTQSVLGTSLVGSAYNKSSDTWETAATLVPLSSGEFSIGVDCQEDGIFVFRQGASNIDASVFPNISLATLSNRYDLGAINPDGGIIVLPIAAVAHECTTGNTRMGAILYGMQVDQNNEILESAFLDLSSSFVTPPSNFKGKVKKNKFATQTDIINILQWNPSPDQAVVQYLIFGSDGTTETISANGPLVAAFHNRKPRIAYTYTIVAVTANGQESSSLSVTLRAN